MIDWIKIEDEMPPKNLVVLLRWERDNMPPRINCGTWIQAKTIEQDSDNDWYDYDEENDIYFIPEGFYEESHENDDRGSWLISGKVTHWAKINSTEN